jgi:hypothetical protein
VPLDTVKGFFDPSVQFGLQFETVTEEAGPKEVAAEEPVEEPKTPRLKRKLADPEAPSAIGPATPVVEMADAKKPDAPKEVPKEAPKETPKPALVTDKDKGDPDKPSGGAEVVRLDRFRKK